MACSKLCPKIETELKFVTVSECRNRVAESFQISSHVVARGVISTASHDAFCGWKQLLCSPTRQRERHGYLLRGSSCPFPPLNSSERKREGDRRATSTNMELFPDQHPVRRSVPDQMLLADFDLTPNMSWGLRCTDIHIVHPSTGFISSRASREMTYSFLLAANSSVLF